MNNPDDDRYSFISPQVAFRRSVSDDKNRKLVSYLVNQIGVSQRGAKILISIHKPRTKDQALELFINQNGVCGHIFVPFGLKKQICQVCRDGKDKHQIFDDLSIEIAMIQLNNRSLEQQNFKSQLKPSKRYESIEQVYRPKIQQAQKQIQKTQLCQICYLQYHQEKISEFGGVKHNICVTCMAAYVEEKIKNMEIESVLCPHCSVKLDASTIRKYVSPKIYQVYQQFKKNAEIQKNPNLMWCPNPKCSVVLSIINKKKVFHCPKCQQRICSKCHKQQHKGKSCDSVFKNQIKSWQNSQKIQKCKKCSSIVQKVSGCNHMSCSICGYEWCWLCGSDYSERHFNPMNPFGCAGMQDRHGIGKCRIILWRIILFFLLLIGIPAMIPFGLLFSGPFVCIQTFYKTVRWQNNRLKKVLMVIAGFLVGLVVNPFVWIFLIVTYSPRFINAVRQYFRAQRRRVENAENRLNQRLINDAIVNSQIIVFEENNQ